MAPIVSMIKEAQKWNICENISPMQMASHVVFALHKCNARAMYQLSRQMGFAKANAIAAFFSSFTLRSLFVCCIHANGYIQQYTILFTVKPYLFLSFLHSTVFCCCCCHGKHVYTWTCNYFNCRNAMHVYVEWNAYEDSYECETHSLSVLERENELMNAHSGREKKSVSCLRCAY